MSALSQGIGDGLSLLVHGDRATWRLIGSSLRIAAESTVLAAVLGVPLGCALGLGDFRGRRALLAVVNASVRIPPVVVGVVLMLLLWEVSIWGGGPLAGLGWLFTVPAMVLAQTLLALPVVAALCGSAVQGVPGGLLTQARAFGATRRAVAVLAVREARIGVFAAVIAAFGVASSAVGAVAVIGGIAAQKMLGPAVLASWVADDAAHAVAYAVVMLAVFLVLAGGLTVAQLRQGRGEAGGSNGAGDPATRRRGAWLRAGTS